jgi:hypothetical protein
MTFRDSASRARIEAMREDLEREDAIIADQASFHAWGARQRAKHERRAAKAAVASWEPAMRAFMPAESRDATLTSSEADRSWDEATKEFRPKETGDTKPPNPGTDPIDKWHRPARKRAQSSHAADGNVGAAASWDRAMAEFVPHDPP